MNMNMRGTGDAQLSGSGVFSSLVLSCVHLGLGICFGPGHGLGLGFVLVLFRLDFSCLGLDYECFMEEVPSILKIELGTVDKQNELLVA